jgi:hypothetical protein
MTAEPAARGAYGIGLRGVEEAADLLVPVGPGDPVYDVLTRVGPGEIPEERVEHDRAQLRLRAGGRIAIDRQTRRLQFDVPHAVRADEIVHPYLAPAAAVIARWAGRESVHAGAFAGRSGTWGLVGGREGGKSSTLAWLARAGAGVIADDLLVLDRLTPLARPRYVSLRGDAAAPRGPGEDNGQTGARERWRVRLGPPPAPAPRAGWVFLSWGAPLELRRVGGSERLQRLAAERSLRLPPVDPDAFLELAALPAWELSRPLGWDSLLGAADRLRELADG